MAGLASKKQIQVLRLVELLAEPLHLYFQAKTVLLCKLHTEACPALLNHQPQKAIYLEADYDAVALLI